MKRRSPLCSIVLVPVISMVLLVSVTGCQVTQSAFVKTTGNAGATFAAAATTLNYLHQGKLLVPYARSSFASFQNELDGLDQQLPSQAGGPGNAAISRLLALYKPAIQAVDAPCLDASCDWRAQLDALKRASQAFLQAGGQ